MCGEGMLWEASPVEVPIICQHRGGVPTWRALVRPAFLWDLKGSCRDTSSYSRGLSHQTQDPRNHRNFSVPAWSSDIHRWPCLASKACIALVTWAGQTSLRTGTFLTFGWTFVELS